MRPQLSLEWVLGEPPRAGMGGNRLMEPGSKNPAWPETWWQSSHLKILKRGRLAWGQQGLPRRRAAGPDGQGLPSRALHTSSSSNNHRGHGGWQALAPDVQSSRPGRPGGRSNDQAFLEHWLFLRTNSLM